MTRVWRIRNDHFTSDQLVADRFISIGWDKLGDLNNLGDDHDSFKKAVVELYPATKPGALPALAGMLRRFAFDMKVGDVVVAPSRQRPVFNLGRIAAGYEFMDDGRGHPHRHAVEWLITDVPKSAFSQGARSEVGVPLTLIEVNDNADEFERALVDGPPQVPEPASLRAWLIRGSSVNGRDLVPTWRSEGWVSLAASNLRSVSAGISRDELKPIVEEDYAHASYAVKGEKLDEFHAFLTRMQEGHLVVTVDQGRLFIGTLAGEAAYQHSSDGVANLVRDVDWADGEGIDYGDLPGELAARLKVQRDVLDLTQQVDTIESLLESEASETPLPVVEPVALPSATSELAEALHVTVAWLQECIDLLNDRPQLIFYGPPGTGKTFIAQALAKHVAGERVRLVQFHPSYSYEDFFEGYRPKEDGGFKLMPGPMRKIVDQAVENPRDAFVLIIDEINRGNLAKVFGELYFLLEYRDQNVELLYADEDFSLPKNVFIIGTMNTADRSIALVDAAMRRRFAFLPLHPSEEPTKDVLRSWLKREGHSTRVADLLEELNVRIEDADFKIGPSYFMRSAVHGDGGLDRTWRTSILPLLEEHHFGELDGAQVASRYGLKAVVAAVDKVADPAQVEPPDAPTDAN